MSGGKPVIHPENLKALVVLFRPIFQDYLPHGFYFHIDYALREGISLALTEQL
jgi:hypothetical protein